MSWKTLNEFLAKPITSVGKNMQKLEPCIHCLWDYTNKVQLSCKRVWHFLKKMKTRITIWSNSSTSGHIPVRLERWFQRDQCSQQHYSQHPWGGNSPSDEWLGKLTVVCTCNGILLSLNRKEILMCTTMSWAELCPPHPANSYPEALTASASECDCT